MNLRHYSVSDSCTFWRTPYIATSAVPAVATGFPGPSWFIIYTPTLFISFNRMLISYIEFHLSCPGSIACSDLLHWPSRMVNTLQQLSSNLVSYIMYSWYLQQRLLVQTCLFFSLASLASIRSYPALSALLECARRPWGTSCLHWPTRRFLQASCCTGKLLPHCRRCSSTPWVPCAFHGMSQGQSESGPPSMTGPDQRPSSAYACRFFLRILVFLLQQVSRKFTELCWTFPFNRSHSNWTHDVWTSRGKQKSLLQKLDNQFGLLVTDKREPNSTPPTDANLKSFLLRHGWRTSRVPCLVHALTDYWNYGCFPAFSASSLTKPRLSTTDPST